MVVKMNKFDFPEMLEETFRGVVEIIYFYIITIIFFLKSPLKIWDKIYREVSKPNSDFDFRNIGLSQPTMFFAISLIIFLYFIKVLVFEEIQITEESHKIFLKILESITNIYEFNIVAFILVIIIANLLFSIIYLSILDYLNSYMYFGEKSLKKIKMLLEKQLKIKMLIDLIEDYNKFLVKTINIFNIKFEKRQENPFSINWTDINSIHRFIAISNYISGILILLFIVPIIIFLKNPDSEYIYFAANISIIVAFLPAWFMSIYSIHNNKSEI